jgi:hypothetical protein
MAIENKHLHAKIHALQMKTQYPEAVWLVFWVALPLGQSTSHVAPDETKDYT